MNQTRRIFAAVIPDNAPPCAHCGTPCARNDYGDWVCVGDPNCFLQAAVNIGDLLCANCGQPFHAHGFGMGNIDPHVGECIIA